MMFARLPLMRLLPLALIAALLALTGGGADASAAGAGPRERRNVLLLISDDQGLEAGCYGSRWVSTPVIDRLASEGVRFSSAFAAVSSCSPSRATLLTGLYNHASGQYGLAHSAHNQKTRGAVRSLPRMLSENGYRTGLLGKYHVGPDEVYPFDVKKPGLNNRRPAALRESVREFLRADDGRPFFLTVGFGDPHRTGSVFPATRRGDRSTTPGGEPSALPLPDFLPGLPEVRQDYADYCASVNNLDRCVGAVLAALEESGATSSTLVIFLSDNGIPFPGAKTNLYDAGIRLPLIIRAPGLGRAGTVCDALASWVDIAPTILEWAGVETGRETMHGRSLLPVLANPEAKAEGRERVFASHTMHEITMYYPMRAIRTRDYKLIWNLAHPLPYPISGDILKSPSWQAIAATPGAEVGRRPLERYLHRPEFELYDLRQDPTESRNLAEDEAHRETLERLKADLLEMMRRTDDPWRATAERGAGL